MPIPLAKSTSACLRGVSRLEVMLCLMVVGVLVALLLPRLAELNDAAKGTRLAAAMGAARAGANAFHARCEAALAATPPRDCTLLTLDGVPVAGVHGWPKASADGIARAAALPLAGADRLNAFSLRAADHQGAPALFIGLGNRSCEFVYVQAKSLGDVPRVDIVDASCH
jgi:hypothetical protein